MKADPRGVPRRSSARWRATRTRSTAAAPASSTPTSPRARTRSTTERQRPDLDPRRPARRELRHLPQRRRPAGLRRQRLRRGLPRPLHLGPAAVRRLAGAGRAGRRRCRRSRAPADRVATSRAYLSQVDDYRRTDDDADDFALYLDNTEGPIHAGARGRRGSSAAPTCWTTLTVVQRTACGCSPPTTPCASSTARERTGRSWRPSRRYLETIPDDKRFDRDLFYDLRDVVGKSGFGIGSAGLPAYNVLVEGYSQALDNDVVLSMKQANVPAVSRFVDTADVDAYFEHEGHRTVVSQRALQVHTDPLLGYTELDGVGYVVVRGLAVRDRPRLGRAHRARRDRGRRRPARPGHRQDPLRLRRGQRAGPRRLPGRGGDRASVQGRRREFVTWLTDFGSRTPPRCAPTTRCSSRPSARAGSASPRPDPLELGLRRVVAGLPTGSATQGGRAARSRRG